MSAPACGNYAEHEAHDALFGNPGEAMYCVGVVARSPECRAGHAYFDNACVRCGERPPWMRDFLACAGGDA